MTKKVDYDMMLTRRMTIYSLYPKSCFYCKFTMTIEVFSVISKVSFARDWTL